MNSRFAGKEEVFGFLSAMLTPSSVDQLSRRLYQLMQDFHTLNQQDRAQPLTERVGFSLFMTFRLWRPVFFEMMRRTSSR